jgi:hypothetical protein
VSPVQIPVLVRWKNSLELHEILLVLFVMASLLVMFSCVAENARNSAVIGFLTLLGYAMNGSFYASQITTFFCLKKKGELALWP